MDPETARAALQRGGGDARAAVAALGAQQLGFDPARLERAFAPLDEAIERRVTPGAVGLVARAAGFVPPVALVG